MRNRYISQKQPLQLRKAHCVGKVVLWGSSEANLDYLFHKPFLSDLTQHTPTREGTETE